MTEKLSEKIEKFALNSLFGKIACILEKDAGLSIRRFKDLGATFAKGDIKNTQKYMFAQSMKNPLARLAFKLKKFDKKETSKQMQTFAETIGDKQKELAEAAGKKVVGIFGTARNKKMFGGDKDIVIDSNLFKTLNRNQKRNLIAHEKFHNVPIVGSSEILAHGWGGLRGGASVYDSGVKGRIRSAINDIKQFSRERPGRLQLELAAAGGAAGAAGVTGAGAYGIKKMTEKKNVKRQK